MHTRFFAAAVTAALLTACAPAEDPLDALADGAGDADLPSLLDGLPVQQAGPPMVFTAPEVIFKGSTGTFEVAGAPPNRTVVFAATLRTQGSLACPNAIAPTCLDLYNPFRVLAMVGANNQGDVAYALSPRSGVRTLTGYVQAVSRDSSGTVHLSNVEEVSILGPNDDEDGDGVTNLDEVTVHGTAWDDADTDGGGLPDGDEIALGTDPLDPSDDCAAGFRLPNCNLDVSCDAGDYPCGDGSCISGGDLCDTVNDCFNGADEWPAQDRCSLSCAPGEVDCGGGTGLCIPGEFLCDGYPDCPGFLDEAPNEPACNTGTDCGAFQYECTDGTCVPSVFACDGLADCPDASDEPPRNDGCGACGAGFYSCGTPGDCVDASLTCDGRVDCVNGEDEFPINPACTGDCAAAGGFECGDGTCLSPIFECDGTSDCLDGSDENPAVCGCQPGEFTCGDGACIPGSSLCDTTIDCADGSDEQPVNTTCP